MPKIGGDWKRDAKYRSQQKWEKDYKRKIKAKPFPGKKKKIIKKIKRQSAIRQSNVYEFKMPRL